MKITFLGTNGWYDTATGNTPSVHIETGQEHIVLDAGIGFSKLSGCIRDDKPVYLFLSHFHLDHVGGLHTLARLDLAQGLHIFGPAGIKKHIGRLITKPFSMPLKDLRTRVMLHELGELKNFPLMVCYAKLEHPDPCFGYRFDIGGKILVYCTDTGRCANLERLASGADLLITECAYLSGQTSKTWGHLNPEIAAGIARQAGAKQLVLMHFDAARYLSKSDRTKARRLARKIFPKTRVAFDGTVIDIK